MVDERDPPVRGQGASAIGQAGDEVRGRVGFGFTRPIAALDRQVARLRSGHDPMPGLVG
jgi:hypothetical protein